ncbi:pyruvate ferredoxin oxidoreductase [Chakrabartyella piscis]|uniref:pyruvate ferredoxin oxidoreductase n=1 Tax=Chakrabartyella piscis TaxID=2918914 RepID=UPI002958A48A|nr:pyruvate ferredoxin oxidoreductase [Chakrabartyella piscis]
MAEGEADYEYMMVESEHSAMAAALGVSMMGARAFTATSSQGLMYMAEMLNYTSGGRHPVVMVNANRALAIPWNIYGDHSDAMAMRDCGWIMLFAESGQEALDMVIQAYKIAEDKDVMLPVMVNVDGFTLTHTYDVVDIPEQELVDAYLPSFDTANKMCLEHPKTLCHSVGPDYYTEAKIAQQEAFEVAKAKIVACDEEFEAMFGRGYGGLIEEYCCDDAEYALVAMGGTVGTVRDVVDELRAAGEKVGLIKIRGFRPFPEEYFQSVKSKFKAMGVIDRSLCFGVGGTVFGEVKSALYGSEMGLKGFVLGLGGRDISVDMIKEMFAELKECPAGEYSDQPIFVGRRW